MAQPDELKSAGLAHALKDVPALGVLTVDLQGIIQSWNRGMEELLGYPAAEAVGRHFEFFFTPEDRAARVPHQEMESALSSNIGFDDRWHLRRDQSRLYVNGGLCLVKSEDEKALGFVKIMRDQTDKRERLERIEDLNRQLQQAHDALRTHADTLETRVEERTRQLHERNAELEAFCYSIAHDIRAPLRNIQAMSQVVVEDYGPSLDETCRHYLGRIARAGARLDRLTLDLLKYSRLSREEIVFTSVNLDTVVSEILAAQQETIQAKNALVQVRAPLPRVHAQHAYVVQIISNFISNALKFVAPGVRPEIRLWAEPEDSRVRVFVQDNGIGIPQEFRERIFHLFERLHSDDAYDGTGVGLAIAHKAAQRINGSIGLQPPAGPGTTFWLLLDAARD